MAKLDSEVYNPKFAACRDLGHEWDYYTWYGSKRTLICANCGMRREEIMDGNFKIIWRRYHQPKGYAWKTEAIPIKRLRAELKREARKLARWAGPKASDGSLRVIRGGKRD